MGTHSGIAEKKHEKRQKEDTARTRGLVAVVGLGYVGLPLAVLSGKSGYQVVGIDSNIRRVSDIRQKIAPFEDAALAFDLKKSSIAATTDMARVQGASVVIVCVPTPVRDGHIPDLRPVEHAASGIAPFLQRGQLVVLESTVNPGVTENIFIPLLEQGSGLRAGEDFDVAHCPERINPGDAVWHVGNIARVVGGITERACKRAVLFYQSLISAPVMPMRSIKEAEAVKVVENSFRDINVAFVNEIAKSFSRMDIDAVHVIKGAATKPFGFLAHYPGCGVGGHCIPVDPYYLIEYGKKNGFYHDFLMLARRINESMPRFTVDALIVLLNDLRLPLKGARIALLGISYKPDIDDTRESPSYTIAAILREYGAQVVMYDPHVASSDVPLLEQALDGSAAVVLATAHTFFCSELKPKKLRSFGVRAVVDGRNALSKDAFLKAGIAYSGIGR